MLNVFPSCLIRVVVHRRGHYPIGIARHARAVSTGPASPHSRGALSSPLLEYMRADARLRIK
jgi:hypothetical protein